MAKMSLEELRKLRESKQKDLQKREVDGKEVQIVVGMGTCGIAAGGKQILDAFLSEVDANGLSGGVVVRQTGCMGMCHSEPTVEIVVPGMPATIYGSLNPELAKDIVRKHVIGKQVAGGQVLEQPSADIMKE